MTLSIHIAIPKSYLGEKRGAKPDAERRVSCSADALEVLGQSNGQRNDRQRRVEDAGGREDRPKSAKSSDVGIS
ncbi:MAG TPA: hypothetical protein VGF48_12205 [Thermoanaerobaculia bacterium]|jgi:hypothetical protein